MGEGSCCHGTYSSLRKNRCIQSFVFLVISALNIADLVSDWMLYHDVKYAEQGLVFGPIDKGIVTALLIFSISGAILFLLEILNLALEIFRENPIINIDAASAIVVWFEDVPQIAINVIIVTCREEALSFFQLTKASVVIIGALLRMLIASIRYCRRKSGNKRHTQTCTVLRCLMLIGTVVMVIGSVIVFTFTQAKWSPDGRLVFPTPKNIWKGQYDEDHYFRGSGIYLSLPRKAGDKDDNWIRLMDINSLKRSRMAEQLIRIDHDRNGENFIFWNGTLNKYNECYKQNDSSKLTYSSIKNCTNDQSEMKNKLNSSLILKFKYTVPHHHLLLGDITFNGKIIKRGQNSTCEGLHSQENVQKYFKLQYFKVKPKINSTHHFLISEEESTTALFYNSQLHLVDISEAWKTGFLGCQTSGRTAPHLNIGLKIDCESYDL